MVHCLPFFQVAITNNSSLANIANKLYLLHYFPSSWEKKKKEGFNRNSSFMCFNSIKIPPNCRLKSLYSKSVKSSASGKPVAFSMFYFLLKWLGMQYWNLFSACHKIYVSIDYTEHIFKTSLLLVKFLKYLENSVGFACQVSYKDTPGFLYIF